MKEKPPRIFTCRECRNEVTMARGDTRQLKTCDDCRIRECKACGETFVRDCRKDASKDAGKYCSKRCYFDAVRKGDQAFKGVKRDAAWQLSQWFSDWNDQHLKAVDESTKAGVEKECEVCGNKHSKDSRVCSRACSYKWIGEKPCRVCGKVTKTCLLGTATCDECKREASRKSRRKANRNRRKRIGSDNWRRRCRANGGKYNAQCKRKEIYERDKYRCHVCRRKVLDQYVQGHPRSPTVDHHPIPLSKGGDHDWHNVRCCCNECNWKKSDQWDGQMALPISFAN